jgi:hypothetical protein
MNDSQHEEGGNLTWVVSLKGEQVGHAWSNRVQAEEQAHKLRELGLDPDVTSSVAVLGAQSSPAPESRRSRKPALIAAVGLLTVLLVGGGVSLAATAGPSDAEKKAASARVAEKKRVEEVKTCQARIGDYIDALTTIDSRLNVGLNVGDYSELAGAASVEQAQVDEDGLSQDCREALDEADAALSDYATSAADWDDCVWDDWCEVESLDLQLTWETASNSIETAQALMNGESGDDA